MRDLSTDTVEGLYYIHRVLQSVCLFVRIGSPFTLSLRECVPPLEPGAGEGEVRGRGSQFGRQERKPGTLSTLLVTLFDCAVDCSSPLLSHIYRFNVTPDTISPLPPSVGCLLFRYMVFAFRRESTKRLAMATSWRTLYHVSPAW